MALAPWTVGASLHDICAPKDTGARATIRRELGNRSMSGLRIELALDSPRIPPIQK
jgi:hypothetical protein